MWTYLLQFVTLILPILTFNFCIVLCKDDFPNDNSGNKNSVLLLPRENDLINYLWDNEIIEPKADLTFNIDNVNGSRLPSISLPAQFIQTVFENTTDGFFVEAEAGHCEAPSNTLVLEEQLGWKGLFIEPNIEKFNLLKSQNRKCWISNACLATKPFTHYDHEAELAKTGAHANGEGKRGVTRAMPCIPLHILLSAINVTMVDYLSLDENTSKLQVLKAISFEDITIKTLSIELNTNGTDEEEWDLVDYLYEKEYRKMEELNNYPDASTKTFMFVHTTFVDYYIA